MTDRDIIAQLVAIRHQRGISQATVARRMYVARPAVSALERGAHSPRLATLLRYAAAVDAKISIEAVTACR